MKKLFLTLISTAFALAILAGLAIGYLLFWYDRVGPGATLDPVVIAPGTGSAGIARQLMAAGWIDSVELFRAATILDGSHTQFKAGEYAFTYGMSAKEIAMMLVEGASITHAITIPEGKSSAEIIALLMADDRLSGIVSEPFAEGTLLPDTHHVFRGDARASVIARMRAAMQETLPTLWSQRADDLPLETPEEAVILASIVEKETGVDGERGKVAAVFINRLRKGMKLQSDPTVVYAIEAKKGPMERALTRKDWEFEHPYNTYVNVGLPPGPICHPGLAALKAVLNPPSHDYLYFVATGRGGHYFAKTLAEHNRNIARYKRELRQQR